MCVSDTVTVSMTDTGTTAFATSPY